MNAARVDKIAANGGPEGTLVGRRLGPLPVGRPRT